MDPYHFKSFIGINFLLWEVIKLKCAHLVRLARMRAFLVWPLPEVQNWFQKQICKDKANISNLNKFLGAFLSKMRKVKFFTSRCIFIKVNLQGGGVFIHQKLVIKSRNPQKKAKKIIIIKKIYIYYIAKIVTLDWLHWEPIQVCKKIFHIQSWKTRIR